MLGDLVFSERFVCFVQIATYKQPTPNWGPIVQELFLRSRLKKSFEAYKGIPAQQGSQSLKDLTMQAAVSIAMPRQSLTKIDFYLKSGLFASRPHIEIHVGRDKRIFLLRAERGTYTSLLPRVQAYMDDKSHPSSEAPGAPTKMDWLADRLALWACAAIAVVLLFALLAWFLRRAK
jgi:hypothetical protein